MFSTTLPSHQHQSSPTVARPARSPAQQVEMQEGAIEDPQTSLERVRIASQTELDSCPEGVDTMQSAGSPKSAEKEGRATAVSDEAGGVGSSSGEKEIARKATSYTSDAPLLVHKALRVDDSGSERSSAYDDVAPPQRLLATAAPSHSFPSSGDVFRTKAAFLSACHPPFNTTEYTYYTMTDNERRIAIACRARQRLGCSFKISALLDDGGWVVAENASCFEHEHINKDVMEASSAAGVRRVVGATSTSSDAEILKRKRHEMEEAQLEQYRQAFPGEIPAMPTLPKIGDRFSSYEIGYLTLRTVIIPVVGVGLSPQYRRIHSRDVVCNRGTHNYAEVSRCKFKIIFTFDREGEGCTVSADSCFSHNHGRDKRIIEDPDWRPRTNVGGSYDVDEDLRKIAELSRGPSESSTSCSTSIRSSPLDQKPPLSPEPRSKRASSSAYLPPQKYRHPPGDRPFILPPDELSKSNTRPQPSPAPSSSASSANLSFQQRQSFLNDRPSHDYSRNRINSDLLFHRQLALFLASLNPSLESTSAILFEAGVKDLSLLVAILSVDEGARDKFLSDVKLPLLQKHLLKKELRSAETSWRIAEL